jgi:hypothetical protein
MKKLLMLSFALLALPSFATDLKPREHGMCLNGLEELCTGETKLYYAELGCGCLTTDQFFFLDHCFSPEMNCAVGTKYSLLHRRDKARRRNIFIGCGCFSVP